MGGMTVTKTKKAQGTRSGSKARSFAEPPWNVILHSSKQQTPYHLLFLGGMDNDFWWTVILP